MRRAFCRRGVVGFCLQACIACFPLAYGGISLPKTRSCAAVARSSSGRLQPSGRSRLLGAERAPVADLLHRRSESAWWSCPRLRVMLRHEIRALENAPSLLVCKKWERFVGSEWTLSGGGCILIRFIRQILPFTRRRRSKYRPIQLFWWPDMGRAAANSRECTIELGLGE